MVSKLLDLVTKKKKNRQYLPSLEKNVMDFRKVVRALHVCFEQMTLRNGTESPEMVVSSVAPSVSSLMTELSWGQRHVAQTSKLIFSPPDTKPEPQDVDRDVSVVDVPEW